MGDSLTFFIKEYCKFCYSKKKYHLLKVTNTNKKCESNNCNNSSPFYANARKPHEYVRDFQNNQCRNESTGVSRCKIENCHIPNCSFAHNDFELFVWNDMKTRKMYKISKIYEDFIEPYIYNPSIEIVPISHQVITNHVNYQPHMFNQVPQTSMENEIIKQDEKKKRYLCWFCLKEITSENNIQSHIDGGPHKAFYEADKKRQWYFKMPDLKISLNNRSDQYSGFEDEYLELCARKKYREFMCEYDFDYREKKVFRWPKWMEFKFPKFPSNLKCYKNPIQLFGTISISGCKCSNFQIYLRDDESRLFFKLIRANENQKIEKFGQLLSMSMDPYKSLNNIEFGIEFTPLYSSTYRQRLEIELKMDKGTFTYCKSIRVDVGTIDHLKRFKVSWEKYKNVVTRNSHFNSYVPFNLEEENRRGIMKEKLLVNVFKVISNKTWINTVVESFNYSDWMRDMMVLEELEQRLILSKLLFHGDMIVKNHLMTSNGYTPANDGKMFGIINFQPNHNWDAREIIIKNVTNCYISFDKLNSSLFECELVDFFRYKYESRSLESVTICISKLTVETMDLKNEESIKIRIYFTFDRLIFDRRHKSLRNIPKYDKLSYNPLVCPSFTRLPYGDDESKIIFYPKKDLNDEQIRLPKLVLRKLETAEIALPFILNGAFGTGKTQVFAETVMAILQNDMTSSILICTRSYSAGELYLNLFNQYIPGFINKIIFVKSDHKRGEKIEKNTTLFSGQLKNETFDSHRVFVTTIENAVDALTPFISLFQQKSMFNFIFVDEAAQVLEVDAIMVYQFGNYKTKFIFAGDIFQTRPELFNKDLKKFSIPIICRLFNTYKLLPNYTICLKQVYRTHSKIVEYLSKAIYCETDLVSLMQPIFPHLKSMKFVDTNCNSRDDNPEKFDEDLSSFKNELEVEFVLNELILLKKHIRIDDDKILICSPFYAQVKLIRDKLRKHKFNNIVVDQPSNIQGREFDAVIISTVLTNNFDRNIPILHPTFHSNKNLINLVISRTKHFIGVIGDKHSLISDNPTRNQWEIFIEMCEY